MIAADRAFLGAPVGVCASWNQSERVGAQACAEHAERPEDLVFQEFLQRETAHFFHDLGKQHVIGVAVVVALTRSEAGCSMAIDDVQRLFPREGMVSIPPQECVQRFVSAQPASVVQQMLDPNGCPYRRKVRKMATDIVFQPQLAAVGQQVHCVCGELLGQGCDVERRLRRYGAGMLDVRHAISLGEDCLPGAVEPDRAAWGVRAGFGGEHLVDRTCKRGSFVGPARWP